MEGFSLSVFVIFSSLATRTMLSMFFAISRTVLSGKWDITHLAFLDCLNWEIGFGEFPDPPLCRQSNVLP
jgi:hypothetical protein